MITRKYLGNVLLAGGMISCAVAACGGGSGGGGDDSGDRNVSGVWRGAVTLTENGCNLSLPATFNITDTVNQNGRSVVLVNETQVQYLGNLVGDNGFSVDAVLANDEITGTVSCDTVSQIEYDGIDDDEDNDLGDLTDDSDGDGDINTANVDIRITRTCTDTTTCRSAFRGTARRSGASDDVTPTPTPTPPVQAADGIDCQQIVERSYTGDGECGIGEVEYSLSGATVVLEPFGINGATSFGQLLADPDKANSTRADLTINGVPGYSCSVQCNGEVTFEVSCFKEGADTCTEKF